MTLIPANTKNLIEAIQQCVRSKSPGPFASAAEAVKAREALLE